jgi:hypothetical protein
MFVKPNAGRTVRDPAKGIFLPASGATVPDDVFWRRRIRDGDVSIVKTATAPTATTTITSSTTDTAVKDTK